MFNLPYKAAYDRAVATPRAFVPLANDAAVPMNQVTYEGFGFPGSASAPGVFRNGWRIATPDSDFRKLIAMFTGSLRLMSPAPVGGPWTIALDVLDPLILQALKHLRPEWMPAPRQVVYENVDPVTLRQSLIAYETLHPDIEQIVRDRYKALNVPVQATDDWTALLDSYFLDASKGLTIPIVGGASLGKMAASSGNPTEFELVLRMEAAVAQPLYLNPSWFIARNTMLFDGLAGHRLEAFMTSPTWGPVSNGVFRFVKKGAPGGDFKTPATASPTIQPALTASADNDTVVILDAGTYSEAELAIERPLTITGFADETVLGDAFNATTTALPKLSGSDTHRVINVRQGANFDKGLVCIRALVIKGGRVQDKADAANYRGGAGILVDQVDRVIVERCALMQNRTFWQMNTLNVFAMMPSSIQDMLNDPPWGLPAAKAAEMKARLLSVKNFGLAGQAFGAGINCLQSSPYILQNRFDGNEAMARGGAVGVAGYGWPVIESNRMLNNKATNATGEGRPDGGAIGIEVAVPSMKPLSLCISDMIGDLTTWLNSLSALDLAGVVGASSSDPLAMVRAFLQPRVAQYWADAKLKSAKARCVVILDNRITGNHSDDDGAGVYFSVLSGGYMAGNTISGNTTVKGAGGGVRITMGSHVTMTNETITGNTSFTSNAQNEGNGGGGLSCRNCELVLKGDTVIEGANQARGWAGGGAFFNASSEGGTQLLFHVILWDAFKFRACSLDVGDRVWIRDNECRDIAGQTSHAKGGGIYILRANPHGDIPTLRVIIPRGRIVNNRARLGNGTDAPGAKAQFNLVDQHASVEHADADYATGSAPYKYP